MGKFSVDDIPALSGKTAIVTGANSGLGLETTRGLAGAGAKVVMACRSTDKAEQAAADIRGTHPQADLEIMALDLADLSSVSGFATSFKKDHKKLDILVNNAGVMALPERRTADGFEMQIGTNHLGHFALDAQLMDTVLATPGARVITVSSQAHRIGNIDLEDLNWERRKYKKWPAYGQAKLANLMFALALQRRLAAADTDVISVAAHPGFAATHLQLAGPEMTGSGLGKLLMQIGNTIFAQSQAAGALPSLYAATMPTVAGGDYYGPDGFAETRGAPTQVQPRRLALNTDVADGLWTLSEKLTGVSFPV